MDRNQALKLLKQHLKSENLINHSLAVEAIMRGIAERLDQDAHLSLDLFLTTKIDFLQGYFSISKLYTKKQEDYPICLLFSFF
jgi:hypothetical protein